MTNAMTVAAARVLARLPGEDERNDALVEACVAEINAAWVSGHLAAARKVGELIVQRFFNGDVRNAHSRSRKHMSYKAVSNHPGLKLRSTDLWYSVMIFEHYPLLGDVAACLTVGHHRQLAHVRDVDQRREYAQRAAAHGLTVRELHEAIKAKKAVAPGEKRRGRPVLHDVLKSLHQMDRTFKALRKVGPEQIGSLDDAVRTKVLDDAKKLAESVATWWTQIQEAAGGPAG